MTSKTKTTASSAAVASETSQGTIREADLKVPFSFEAPTAISISSVHQPYLTLQSINFAPFIFL